MAIIIPPTNIDNIPIPIIKFFFHPLVLSLIVEMILAIPITINETDNNTSMNDVVILGYAITIIDNIIVKAPSIILEILDDLLDDLDKIPIPNLSIPIAKRAIASSVVINPTAIKICEITKPEIITEIIPRTICKIRNAEGFLFVRF